MGRNPLVIVGLVIFGLLALGLTAFMLMSRSAPQEPVVTETPATQIWVASREIPPRTQISDDMLESREIAGGEEVPAGAVTDREELIGRLVVQPIATGQPVTAASLGPELERAVSASFPIPPNLRAVAVYVNAERTAAGLVDAGDRVDVVVAHKLTVPNAIGGGNLETVSGRTIAQNLEVLAVDRSLAKSQAPPPAEPAEGEAGQAPPPPPPPPEPNTAPATEAPNYRVILAAPPNVAERIVAANTSGEINLTIRNPDSNDILPSPDQALEYPVRLVNNAQQPAAATSEAQKAATERAEKIRQERREERLAVRNRRWELEDQRRQNAQAKELIRMQKPPMPTNILPPVITRDPPPRVVVPPLPNEVLVVRGTEKTRVAVPDR